MVSVFNILVLGLVAWTKMSQTMETDMVPMEDDSSRFTEDYLPKTHHLTDRSNSWDDLTNDPQGINRKYVHEKEHDQNNEAIAELIGEYPQVVVPHALVLASQVLHSGSNCTNLKVSLHSNTVTSAMLLRPSWIEDSPSIGSCPTKYVVKHLGHYLNPSALLEAKCLCDDSPCSRMGHQCVPVRKQVYSVGGQVPIWRRRIEGVRRQISLHEVTVACACVLRPGRAADYIPSRYVNK